MKIILAFDSFKGSATSAELAAAAADGIAAAVPGADVEAFVLADGGEGTTEALCRALDARQVVCDVCNPVGELIKATYAVCGDKAIIETASASGLTLLDSSQRNPLKTGSYGTGQLIADALGRGCHDIVLGLGGSATNDAATGILAALGYRFLDSSGAPLEPCGANLINIATIDGSQAGNALAGVHFTLACDVDNPFCGCDGAAYVYAPQKGATPDDVRILDEGLAHYADLLMKVRGMDVRDIPGAGAAGGIAGGLLPFVDAHICSGIDTVLDILGFDAALDGAGLVLTGEGRIDSQSAHGKAVSGIVRRAAARCVPVVALAGDVADCRPLIDMGLTCALSIQTGPLTAEEAMRKDNTLRGVRQTAEQAVKLFCAGKYS